MIVQDVYVEQLVHRKRTAKDILLKILLVVGAVLLCAGFVFCALSLPAFAMIFYLLLGLTAYGAFMMLGMFKVEYEYINTNGDVDIDKIIGQRRRTRLISFACKDIEEIGVYDAAVMKSRRFDRTFDVRDNTGEVKDWYLVFHNPGKAPALLLFSGYENFVKAFAAFLKWELRKEFSKTLEEAGK